MLHEESQAGETPILRALLPTDPVVYVDVGAGEYAEGSDTWPFYKAGGHGLLIEPREELWEELIVNRPRDVLCTQVVLRDPQNCVELRLAGGATTVRKDWNIDHILTGTKLVRSESLRDILSRYPHIRDDCHFCTIDVEGSERQVLLGADWETFRPEVLMIEYIRYERNRVGEDISAEWAGVISPYYYRECCRSWLNIIYLRRDLWHRWEATGGHVPLPHATLEETQQYMRDTYGEP